LVAEPSTHILRLNILEIDPMASYELSEGITIGLHYLMEPITSIEKFA